MRRKRLIIGSYMIDKPFILIIYRSSQSLKIVDNVFGICI